MSNDLQPTVILIVEDDALVRMLASDILTEAGGYRVIEAVNADEALTLLEARDDIRLVLTDVDMPGTSNGVALAHSVAGRFPGIKVIVTSGRMLPKDGGTPKRMPFLPKPYAPATLIRLVRQALGKREEPAMVPQSTTSAVKPSSPVLPAGLTIDQPHTGLGAAGGLAQPLPEPDE